MDKKQISIALMAMTALPVLGTLGGHGHQLDYHSNLDQEIAANDTVTDVETVPYDSASRDNRHLYMIRALARSKGDSILLRWAPDNFVSWALSNEWGYNLYRMDHEGNIDTLARGLRPYSLDQLKQHFAPSDSLAGAAAQLLYGQGTLLDNVASEGVDGILRVHDEQQTRYAYAMLLAEIRPDLAEAMALKYVDREVRKGETYEYVVGSAVPDSFLRIGTVPVTLKNIAYKAAPYRPVLRDSIGEKSITLRWPYSLTYSTHDIERRYNGGAWTRLNKRPYITLTTQEADSPEANVYEDKGLVPGTYEYRVRGYDSFGDQSGYSDVHRVELPDLVPPAAPLIKRFIVDHGTPGKVYADIIWQKQHFEDDFEGYNVFFYNNTVSPDWEQLNLELVAREDTLFRCDITGLGTGLITVTAVDTAGNFAPSTPYELHVTDLVPPQAPTGLRYTMSPSGNIKISWDPNPEEDVASYQLLSANDSTHAFIPMAGKITSDTFAFDTLAVRGVNQKYIYYAVRANDLSGNVSELSEPLQVLRKNYARPAPCRPDTAWTDDHNVYMRWFPSSEADVDSFFVYRRLEGSKIGELIQVLPVDSLRGGMLYVSDRPEYNPTKRYYYGIETINATGISSELSFEIPFLFKGPRQLPIGITLDGVFREDEGKIIIGWKVDDLQPDLLNSGYFCIYRKLKDDAYFRFIRSVAIEERTVTDREVPEGESAEYEVRIRTSDGRLSPLSNRIKIFHPVKEPATK